jgi:flavodoxin I
MKIAILYGSTTGKTGLVARCLAGHFPGAELLDVAHTAVEHLGKYDAVLVGTSTWGTGILQNHWARRMATLPASAFAGKTLAFFGLGDRQAFPETFCAGMEKLKARYAPAAGRVLGPDLVLDHDNEGARTEALVEAWARTLEQEGLC